nr:hypothetical protein [Ktedonobacteraceae bacterium]
MAMQPILENGEVVDEYDDDQPEETAKQNNYPQEPVVVLPATESSTATPVPVDVPEEAPTQGAPAAQPALKMQTEDPTDFDLSDVSIQILLHRADGDPQGRLVSIIVHNFSGAPIIEVFRETELTDKSRLDSIHRAIYPLMQRFLLDLS